jgi:hypothetical protein
MDVPAVFRADATEVEDLALAPLYRRKRGARHLHQAVRLRHFSRTGVLAARRTVDEKKPGRKGRVAMPEFRRRDGICAASHSTEV